MIKNTNIENYLKKELAKTYDISEEKFSLDLNLKNELDSLDILELLVTVENEYDVTFDYKDIEELETVGAVIEKFELLYSELKVKN